MFVGTSYAWFTDQVESGYNRIQTGNLEVVLEYCTVESGSAVSEDVLSKADWKEVSNTTKLFTKDVWSPGDSEVVYLRIRNTGELDLKYQLGLNVKEDKANIQLSDYIQIMESEDLQDGQIVFGNEAQTDENDTQVSNDDTQTTNSETTTKNVKLKADKLSQKQTSEIVAITVSMPNTTSEEIVDSDISTIKLGVTLSATQVKSETESSSDAKTTAKQE
jgi:hypothetical protein